MATLSPARRDMLKMLAGTVAGGLVGSRANAATHGGPTMVPLDSLAVVARGLNTPEGIAGDRAGTIYVSNQDSTCLVIRPDGTQRHSGPALAANGIAPDGRGGIITAVFGLLHDGPGPLMRLDLATGAVAVLAESAEGRTLRASNFPVLSRDGGIYCSHSTWANPGNIGTREAAGFVYRVDPGGSVTVVARGIRGANGCCFDAGERHLYVAQTAAGNILRFRRTATGFGPAEVYATGFGRAVEDEGIAAIRNRIAAGDRDFGYPDGIGFDQRGNLWVTLPFANRIVAVTPQRKVITVLSDAEGRIMDMPTNIAWGGAGLRDLLVVSRRNGNVLRTRSPVPGLPLVHQASTQHDPRSSYD